MTSLPQRQIHLDFHTSPLIPDVGRDFDPVKFVKTLKAAHVNSITVFAKGHHGMSYHPTKVGCRHPGLRPGLDLLGEMIAACHAEDIRVPIYISLGVDEHACKAHPEWRAIDIHGKFFGRELIGDPAGWGVLDMSTPYQDYLYAQTEEILANYPCDGIFFDMCWDQESVTPQALESMADLGLDPASPSDRAEHAAIVTRRYMERFTHLIRGHHRGASIYYNSRPLLAIHKELDFYSHLEVECLPTGGWGYDYFPVVGRYVRKFDKPKLTMTARFHKSWSDFGSLKNRAALEYECFQMLAYGSACSIGDQLHPRGRLNREAYRQIGEVYEQVAQREPWCKKAESVAQIGVVMPAMTSYHPDSPALIGAVKMLQELHHQFDVIDFDDDLNLYEAIVLPDEVRLCDKSSDKLARYLKRGGKVLMSYRSGLAADADKFALPQAGLTWLGEHEYNPFYLRIGKEISADLASMDHVCYLGGAQVKAGRGVGVLARIAKPYFNRTYAAYSGHNQTPVNRLTPDPGVTQKEEVIYLASPVFTAYAKEGYLMDKLLVRNCLGRLIDSPLIEADLPSTAEVHVTRQKNRTIVHLLHYIPQRRTPAIDIIEDVIPLYDVPISLRLDKRPRRVYTAPDREKLEFDWTDDRADLILPELRGHTMLIFEE